MAGTKRYYEGKKGSTTTFVFDKIYDYFDFIKESKTKVVGKAKRVMDINTSRTNAFNNIAEYGSAWYGTTNVDDAIKEPVDEFILKNELNEFLDEFRNDTVNADLLDIDQKKKIEFTSMEKGIFSFDLASLGLIRVYEYFSPVLSTIVDANFVRSYKNDQKKIIFYHIEVPTIERHKVEKRGAYYYSPVLKKNVAEDRVETEITEDDVIYYHKEQLRIAQHDVVQRQKLDANGKKMFSSTFKKSFIYIPPIERKLPKIDIIISSAYSWRVNAREQMIWGCMSAIAIAEKLEKSGIDYRIFVCSAGKYDKDKRVFSFIKIKDTGEPLNVNGIAVTVSDARFFRNVQIQGYIATAFAAGYGENITGGIAIPINNRSEIKEQFMEYLNKTNQVSDSNMEASAANKIVFGQVLDREDAVDQYNDIIKWISRL